VAVTFVFARDRSQYDPKWDRIRRFARDAQHRPLIVKQGTVLNHAATQQHLLDYLALALQPLYTKRGPRGPDNKLVQRHLDADLFIHPVVMHRNGGEGSAICMHARAKHARHFSSSQGYVKLVLGWDVDNKPVYEHVHRLICWLRHGPPTDWMQEPARQSKLVAAHAYGRYSCNNRRSCMQPCHLSWQSIKDNLSKAAEWRHNSRCLCAVHLVQICCSDWADLGLLHTTGSAIASCHQPARDMLRRNRKPQPWVDRGVPRAGVADAA
jgi:hypothetical protein